MKEKTVQILTYESGQKFNILKRCIHDAQNVFDLMAGIYHIIAPYSPQKHEEALRCGGYNDELVRSFNLFCEREKTDGIYYAFTELKERLKEWLTNVESEDVSSSCYKIIFLIDVKCADEHFWGIKEPGQISEFDSLNSEKTSDKYLIVPMLGDIIMNKFNNCLKNKENTQELRKRIAEKQPTTLYGQLKYHLILESNKNQKNLRFHVPYNSGIIHRSISRKNYEITVGLFPLTNIDWHDLFHINQTVEDDKKFFSVDGFQGNTEHVLLNRFIEAIEICKKNHVDFAVFPEMLCSKNIVEIVSEYIENGYYENFPFFIWLGSAWNNNTNKCTIIDCYGKTLFEQYKQSPFVDNEGHTESLSQSDNTIHILDIDGIGRFMTGICKDITDIDLIAIIKKLFADFLILPAFSQSLDIARVPLDLGNEWTVALCSNTCAVRQPAETVKVSFLSVPAKNQNTNKTRIYWFPDGQGCNKCASACPGFLAKVKFMEPEECEGGVYSPVIEPLH